MDEFLINRGVKGRPFELFDPLNWAEEKFITNTNFTSRKSSASVTVMFFTFPFLHFFFKWHLLRSGKRANK